MKIHLVETDLFHVDGRMDRQTDGRKDITQLRVAFRNVANAPKNSFTFFLFNGLHDVKTPSTFLF